MNFYITIFKKNMKPKIWVSTTLVSIITFSILIFSINVIVDPYNITNYNILNIKHKFTRDDRVEKLNYFKTLNTFSNIIIGSSRVLSMNPSIVTNILGGRTYNFGLGGASVEDELGVLLYLQRENKLPKNIILGVDYYTFNPKVAPNKYFLKNQELNFLTYDTYSDDYMNVFFSFDALRASIKTIKYHIIGIKTKSVFDKNGWTGGYEDYAQRDEKADILRVDKEIGNNIKVYYTNLDYSYIDIKRKKYYEQIRNICLKNNINLYVFTTPLHPKLLNILRSNPKTKHSLNELVTYLSTFQNFHNFFNDTKFNSELRHFHASTHTSTNAGDIILKKILSKN